MGELQWYFPSSLDEVPGILAREGVAPHGGGTGLLRAGLGQLSGLMDLGRLGLDFVRLERGSGGSAGSPAGAKHDAVVLGAALTYAAAASEVATLLKDPGHILAQGLGQAATTPLRNRITLGGSLALAPYWSDLLGPLVALEAQVRRLGAQAGTLPAGQYVKDRGSRPGSLVTEIAFPALAFRATYHRHTRTPTDRPVFTITVLRRAGAARVEDPRIVLSGSSGRFQRLGELEGRLAGQRPGEVDPAAALAGIGLELPARMGFSAEYLQAVARVELERALAANLRGD